jgi:molybdenum cofactor biosynthesis protein MoaC
MRNISNKIETLRTARAEALVKIQKETVQLLKEGRAPKGDPFPLAKGAAVMAAKKTSDLIPYCHPILIDSVKIDFEFREGVIAITAEVTAVAKTGVEMEALTAASVAALTIYDMLKPVDQEMEILGCRLLEKRGGKSTYQTFIPKGFKAAIIVTSDSTARGERPDRSGKLIHERLTEMGVPDPSYVTLPDDRNEIKREILGLIEKKYHLILTTGGTGLGPRDVTVEAVRELVEREVPGISEAMRSFGQRRTPYAMLSRGVAGICKNSLIVTLPGSLKGVEESMAAIFPALFHLYPITEGNGH